MAIYTKANVRQALESQLRSDIGRLKTEVMNQAKEDFAKKLLEMVAGFTVNIEEAYTMHDHTDNVKISIHVPAE